jgi:hypothetical protein
MAWDALREAASTRANKLYLGILQVAAQEGEAHVVTRSAGCWRKERSAKGS